MHALAKSMNVCNANALMENSTRLNIGQSRGVINDKAGKAAALPKFSDMLTLSLPRGTDYVTPLALPHLKFYRDYAPAKDCL